MQSEKSAAGDPSWRARFERFLSGRAHSDPLYLSNRRWPQRLKLAAFIVTPGLILVALVLIASTDLFHLRHADPYAQPLAAASPPPAANQPSPDPALKAGGLEVVQIRIAREVTPPVVIGLVRNNTNRKIASAAITYYLADSNGSQMGSETTTVQNIEPHAGVSFRVPLKLANAELVFVRDVHPN